jgi:hypothetical protein
MTVISMIFKISKSAISVNAGNPNSINSFSIEMRVAMRPGAEECERGKTEGNEKIENRYLLS